MGGYFDGDMKYFGIWNRTLSTTEMMSLNALNGNGYPVS